MKGMVVHMKYYPEGWLMDTQENREALLTSGTLLEACREGKILEARR